MTNQQPSLPFHSPFPVGKARMQQKMCSDNLSKFSAVVAELQKPYPTTAGSASAWAWTGLAFPAPLLPSSTQDIIFKGGLTLRCSYTFSDNENPWELCFHVFPQ